MYLWGVNAQLDFAERKSSTIQDTELEMSRGFDRIGLQEKINEV